MDIIQHVFDLSEQILATEPFFVTLNQEKIGELAEQMKNDGKVEFFDEKPYHLNIHLEIIKELIASSINYCYWYGYHDIRPMGVSSTSMYNHLDEAFGDAIDHALNFELRIEKLIGILSKNRYPLLEDRKRHLLELCENRKTEIYAATVFNKHESESRLLFDILVRDFQGFASDQFLKRASLFFIQLYRKFGWFKNTLMTHLFVPADYQVPKILRHFGAIEYNPELEYMVDFGKLIEKHSLMELQIRAATVKACTELQYKLGWTIADVDTYLWTKRKLTDKPFHLTITSDY